MNVTMFCKLLEITPMEGLLLNEDRGIRFVNISSNKTIYVHYPCNHTFFILFKM